MLKFANKISVILNDIEHQLKDKAVKQLKLVSEDSVNRLKETSPVNKNTTHNHFRDNWEFDLSSKDIYSVIRQSKSGKKGSLIHLLNDGHRIVSRSGKTVGSAKGTKFFDTEREKIFKDFYGRIEQIVDDVRK